MINRGKVISAISSRQQSQRCQYLFTSPLDRNKNMRKMDKKIENQLRLVLIDVCEIALKEIDGFQWLTHTVNYSNFSKSLKVVCVFDTNENVSFFKSENNQDKLAALIELRLAAIDIKVKSMVDHIIYDTEENCSRDNDGNWSARLG